VLEEGGASGSLSDAVVYRLKMERGLLVTLHVWALGVWLSDLEGTRVMDADLAAHWGLRGGGAGRARADRTEISFVTSRRGRTALFSI